MKYLIVLVLVMCTFYFVGPQGLPAQGLHAKIEARKKESEKPKPIAGGVRFQVAKSFDATYEKVVNWVNHEDYTIDPAETRKEIGQITTVIAQTSGGYSQSGRRLRITVIKDDETTTTLKVIVEDLKRKKLLAAEPWSDPKLNEKESQLVADQVKGTLQ